MSIRTKTCQAVIDGFRDNDFTDWDVLGRVEDGMFCIGLHNDLCLVYDPGKPVPFVLDIRGIEFTVRNVEWRWNLTISLDGWDVTVRRTT